MVRAFSYLLFLIFTFAHVNVRAGEPYRRVVNFEWEPIEGAKFYEIELRKKVPGSKTSAFKTEAPEWSGKLQVGRYEFRLRSLDKRKVPGDWSGYADLDVFLEPVKIKKPEPNAPLKAQDQEKQAVKFEWSETPGAVGYVLEIFNDKNEPVATEKTSSTDLSYTFETARSYTWKIKAVSEEGLESETSELFKLDIMGPKLAKANIEKPETEFVRELKWQPVEKAEHYDIVLAKYNSSTKKWQKFREFENFKETSLNFESDWPGGKYKIMIKAKAPSRDDSELASVAFPVREGTRTPAAEYVATMRKSIDRVDGWFSQASWYASSISLDTRYRDAAGFSTTTITGTGRFSIGQLKSESPWGYQFSFDVGGFSFEDRVYNFFGTEFSMVRRNTSSDRSEIRYLGGVFHKEFPALYTTLNSIVTNVNSIENVDRLYGKGGVIGLHGGVEYWYSISPKLGFQANAHLYIPMAETEMPNGGKYEAGSDVNLSVGVLGSYRYSSKLTGLVGLNYRMESYSYTDNSDPAQWSLPIYRDFSNKVRTNISGIFLNLMAEYAF